MRSAAMPRFSSTILGFISYMALRTRGGAVPPRRSSAPAPRSNPGSGMEVMILGCVGAAHTPQNHYLLRTTLIPMNMAIKNGGHVEADNKNPLAFARGNRMLKAGE